MQASNAHMQSVLVYSSFVQGSFALIDDRIYVALSSHVNRILASGAFDSTIQDMFERKLTFLKWSLAGSFKMHGGRLLLTPSIIHAAAANAEIGMNQ